MIIYHITTEKDWHEQSNSEAYIHESLQLEGFIHCSKNGAQVDGVLERYFKGQKNLLLLHIDTTKLINMLKFELAPSVNEEFPHIYGSINKDAIVNVELLK